MSRVTITGKLNDGISLIFQDTVQLMHKGWIGGKLTTTIN